MLRNIGKVARVKATVWYVWFWSPVDFQKMRHLSLCRNAIFLFLFVQFFSVLYVRPQHTRLHLSHHIMSSGGLLQLVAYGAQDGYISNDPQISFWRIVYRRHTNFAMESLEQSFTGSLDFQRKATCLIARNGDLIHKAYLQIELPPLVANPGQTVAWTRNIGHVIIDDISVEIGGGVIDKHYGMWYTIYNELTQVAEKEDAYNVMIGNTKALTDQAATIPAATLYVPLIFWFCKSPGLALPLIALLYHDVKLHVQFRSAVECYITSDNIPLSVTPQLSNVSLYLDYIFLDSAERRMFSQANHEYLIETLQTNGAESYSNAAIRQKLGFSHPTKELIWVVQPDANVVGGANRWTDFTDSGVGPNPYAGNNPMADARIQLNTHDRISQRKAAYFNLVQPYFHHTRCPATGIFCYSFALSPENHQPSGSINMSRIEGVNIMMTLTTGTSPVRVYPFAISYNILRITSGQPLPGRQKYHAGCKQAMLSEKPFGPLPTMVRC